MPLRHQLQKILTKKKKKKTIIEVNVKPGEFDLASYIANYPGQGKIKRLLFIAEHCKTLEVDALKMALETLKKTTDTLRYKTIAEKNTSRLGPVDQSWIDQTEKRAIQQQEKLEVDLNTAKTNLIKESIRVGHHELGDFFFQRGDLNASVKSYVRTRDYCTNSKQMLSMCMNVVRVSLELENWSYVASYAAKAEQIAPHDTPAQQQQQQQQQLTAERSAWAHVRIAQMLAALAARNYRQAARHGIDIPAAYITTATATTSSSSSATTTTTTSATGSGGFLHFTDIIAPQDIAAITALCALATFDRNDIKKRVIDNPAFRNYLDLYIEVRDMLSDFYNSRYASCLKLLDKIKTPLMLDMWLHEHVEHLYRMIREKAMVQYFSPFTSVNLVTMAQAFNCELPQLEKELAKLINDNAIAARIDSHNKRLYARQIDQRTATFEKTVSTGEEYENNTKILLLRMSLQKNDFLVRPRAESKSDKKN